jgi:predicted GNAT family acetyltransferase
MGISLCFFTHHADSLKTHPKGVNLMETDDKNPEHQPQQHRFVTQLDDQKAVLEYKLLPGNGIDFTRTFVPEALRGQGIAEKLVRTAIAWAREQGYEMQASCWYVTRFLKSGKKKS